MSLRRVEPPDDQPGIRPTQSPRLERLGVVVGWAQWLLARPVPTLVGLSVLVLAIELAQSWPQFVPGAHAASEYLRNMAYAIIGALVFHWILVQVPEERRRRLTYISREQSLQLLVQTPASLIEMIRLMGRTLQLPESDVDAWDRRQLRACLEALDQHNTAHLRSSVPLLITVIDSMQLSLDTLEPSVQFVHEDVAQALALYPGTKGLHQLQAPPPEMAATANRWEHITWELLEAARRLQAALRENAPYLDLKIEGGEVSLGSGETSHPRLEDIEAVPAR